MEFRSRAALSAIGAIALQGFRQVRRCWEVVAVIGAGLVGVLTIQLSQGGRLSCDRHCRDLKVDLPGRARIGAGRG
jgi:hypothetical protein